MLKIKQFFKMMKYEFIRVTRNKTVLIALLCFSLIFLAFFSIVSNSSKKVTIAMYTNGVDIEQAEVMSIIDDLIDVKELSYVSSPEEGVRKVQENSVSFFICLSESETKDITKATFYYDQSNFVASSMVSKLTSKTSKVIILEFLKKYGITLDLNAEYFEIITFKTANARTVDFKQMAYSVEVACSLSIVILLGIAYSLARDNETSVSKNISYMPIGANQYLLTKAIPYIFLGFVELLFMYILGIWFFNIHFELNFFLVLLLSIFFVISIVAMSLLFSLLKSQIASVFFGLICIVVPLFTYLYTIVQSCPIFIQILLYSLPIVPFVQFLNPMIFSGIVVWWIIPVLIVQSIVYYSIALIILKKRVRG